MKIKDYEMGNVKIRDWNLWQTLCKRYNIDPYEYVDFSVGVPSHRQITGGESIDYEYVGEVPEKEE